MKIAATLLNRSEKRVSVELENIARDNRLRIFSMTRLSDIIDRAGSHLTQREFDFYTRSHADFVIADADTKPLMIVEYDGPMHLDARQQERDRIKNELCRRAGLGLLRIHDRHVTKLYRGMSVLRWIVEVSELEKAFAEAQTKGEVPHDEPFDPAFIMSVGDRNKYPYWLSASATQSFHNFFKKLNSNKHYGWHSIVAYDDDGTGRRLSWLYFDEKIIWAKTSVRRQDLDFPHDDLLDQIDTCELGIRLQKYISGEIRAISINEFQLIFDPFCERYNPRPSHSMGKFPFARSWDFASGWKGK